jgi:hypothetical protein
MKRKFKHKNSTNINKRNNHLLPRLNEKIIKKKKTQHTALEIQVLTLDRHKNVARLYWLMFIMIGRLSLSIIV